MELNIRNIGKIGLADVVIDGITVIGGQNGTGKSSISRALFSMFSGFYEFEKRIEEERRSAVSRYMNPRHNNAEQVLKTTRFSSDLNSLVEFLKADYRSEGRRRYYEDISDDEIERNAKAIQNILTLDSKKILQRIVLKDFKTEYNEQPVNINSNESGSVELKIKDKNIKVTISDEGVDITDAFILNKKAIYIDDPFILDNLDYRFYRHVRPFLSSEADHRNKLHKLLRERSDSYNAVDSLIMDEKFDRIYEKVNSVCGGLIEYGSGNGEEGFSYREKQTGKKIKFQNLASGLKTFVLIKLLVEQGHLEENGIMIFDEPEIHLHPEWQLVLAELIVLIQKEMNMHILINTHSPYFLDAIDVYSSLHGIREKCRFYLAYLDDGKGCVEDVSESIEKIYKLLARPFQELENLRHQEGVDET